MKDVQQLLTEKETELARIQKEIRSLQMVLPLLADETVSGATAGAEGETNSAPDRKPPESSSHEISHAQATGTDGAPAPEPESKIWGFAKRWRNKSGATNNDGV